MNDYMMSSLFYYLLVGIMVFEKSSNRYKGRIIKLEFRRNDLTPDGEKFFMPFVTKFFSYTDRTAKTPSEKLITKWLNEVKINKNRLLTYR